MTAMASRISPQRFDLVPVVMPARLPALLKSWQGVPAVMTSTFGTLAQSTFVTSPRFGTSGQWWARILDGAASNSAHHDISPPRTDCTPIPSPE